MTVIPVKKTSSEVSIPIFPLSLINMPLLAIYVFHKINSLHQQFIIFSITETVYYVQFYCETSACFNSRDPLRPFENNLFSTKTTIILNNILNIC